MSKENNLILELWELLKEYVTNDKHRSELAVRYLKLFSDYDMDDDFDKLQFEDHWLEDAMAEYEDHVDDDDDYMEEDE